MEKSKWSQWKDSKLVMTPAERGRACVMVVETDASERANARTALKALGYGGISDAPNHAAAIEKLNDRQYTHVIFDARKTNMPPREFLQKVLESYPNCTCIPSSYQPDVDDVFDLLIGGARGFLSKPFTIDTLEDAIVLATKGEPISDAVLGARDRNEALTAILMGSLDKTATILRQAEQFETAKREVPKCLSALYRASELAKTFAKGGHQGLLDAIEKFCVERSKGPATKLGRLRKRLHTDRAVDDQPTPG